MNSQAAAAAGAPAFHTCTDLFPLGTRDKISPLLAWDACIAQGFLGTKFCAGLEARDLVAWLDTDAHEPFGG